MTTSTQAGSTSAFRPLAPFGRTWRRLRRRPRAMQVRTVLMIVAVVVGLVAWLLLAPAGTPGSPEGAGASEAPVSASTPTPVNEASTSSRGVSAHSINVVFPVISLSSVTGIIDIAGDREYGDQTKAIHLYVNQINRAGGIHGRDINPIIVPFNPTDAASMRALCKQWTLGSPPVFAVIDGIGAWTGDDELCITQEGHTPMIAAWTTTTNWTDEGSPYLWWTGADDAPILAATVSWGLKSGRLGHGKKVGVVVSDQSSDQTALNSYLLPDLKKAGIKPQIYTISADLGETASTSSDATLAVERLKAAGVQSVIPLLPANAFEPYVGAETQQQYFPTLLLSDYQSSIEFALGVIPVPYERALDGQEGVTAETLGGFDDARPESQGGYDPGVRSCFATWHKAYPAVPKGEQSYYIEEQGPVQGWCTAIRLFAAAATKAGPNLNRRTFVTAMSTIKNFPGGLSPVWTFGPDKFYGPTTYQVVKVHNNVPPSSQCVLKTNHRPQGTCWVSIPPYGHIGTPLTPLPG
ncbi:MAG: ABC transporter substrate-binding protein [Acidimicrobiales bacterium]